MAIATDAEILPVLERWARVRGFVMHDRDGYQPHDGKRWGLHVNLLPPRGSLLVVTPGQNELMGVEVSPVIALAWALLVETDAPVDVGPCPACVARSGKHGGRLVLASMEWRQAFASSRTVADRRFDVRDGWTLRRDKDERSPVERARARALPGRYRTAGVRPCPECRATTRATLPVARMLLDAVSGDVSAREQLHEHADQLQATGDPLGELLAWALGPWAGEPSEDAGPCDAPNCDGVGWYWGYAIGDHETDNRYTCDACSGSGRLRGHPHTAEVVRWLDRLTDHRLTDPAA